MSRPVSGEEREEKNVLKYVGEHPKYQRTANNKHHKLRYTDVMPVTSAMPRYTDVMA
jgi:hypothetical protein